MSQELISDQGKLVRAELDMQISTAKAYPRKQKEFFKTVTELATQSKEIAQSCFYRKSRRSREGKIIEIEGPSIRLAEIAAYVWGNLHAGKRVVKNDGQFITAEGIAWDLEKNVQITSHIQRSIIASNGARYNSDMQTCTGNAAASIALRNAIFIVIPKALIDPIWEKAKQFALSGKKDLQIRLRKTLDHFNKHSIDTKRILNFFQKRSLEELEVNDIAEIFSTANAIKEKLIEVDQAFLLEDEKGVLSSDVGEHLKNLLNNETKN